MCLGTSLHYAWRRAAKQRGLGVVLIVALALGLGGATAITALARHVLLNPLGLPQPQQVVHIYAGGDPATVADYAKLPAFAAVTGYHPGGLTITAVGLQSHEIIASVTRGFFRMAGIAPLEGREFSTQELQAGERVAIISDTLAGAFHGAAIGQSVSLGGTPFTVIGVMPPRFGFPDGTAVWIPYHAAQRYLVLQNGPLYGGLIARLRPESSLQQADAQVKAEMEREVAVEEAANPGQKYGMSSAFAASLVKSWSHGSQPTVDLLLGAAGLLWLVACFGFGGVLLARALGDQKEIATRMALGGGRLRLALQWLSEALVVVAPATIAGAAVASGLMAALRRGAPASMLGIDLLRPEWIDALTLVGLALLTVLVVAIPPMLSTLRQPLPAEMLQSAFYGRVRTSVLWPVLVVAELTVALVLTAGAALLLASYVGLMHVNLGFQPHGVAAVTYTTAPELLSLAAQARAASSTERKAILAKMATGAQVGNAAALAAAQLVALGCAALIENAPFSKMGTGVVYFLPAAGDWHHSAGLEPNLISGPYLQVLGLPLLRGRAFNSADNASAPKVAIISQGATQSLWGNRDPIGRLLYMGNKTGPITVVGETADILAGGAIDDTFAKGQVYFPAAQPSRGPAIAMTVVARGTNVAALLRAVGGVAGVELLFSTTLDAAAARILAPQRFSLRVMEMSAALALLLIWLAVVGLLAHWVAGRRHEIAIRLALGASPRAMARTVLLRVGGMLAAAIALGLTFSPLEKDVVGHLLVGVSALDARLWAGAATLVCLVGLAAAAIPARRAARIEPADVLRYE
ncbi:MAG: FtsX-like permease family protein [Acidobacteria bacterium]|nr:MAG: FtsX-like permease family protein [Acidobacteriota bacterium]